MSKSHTDLAVPLKTDVSRERGGVRFNGVTMFGIQIKPMSPSRFTFIVIKALLLGGAAAVFGVLLYS